MLLMISVAPIMLVCALFMALSLTPLFEPDEPELVRGMALNLSQPSAIDA